jgi:hypothetical protein
MAKSASEIVDRALNLIDEAVTTFNTAATTETSIRDQALAILPEVCRDLVKELPWALKRYLAETAALVADTLTNGESQSLYYKQKVAFQAPSNFWELVSMRLTVWAKPVTDYIHIGGESYEKQNNPFTRAGKQNPVVAINNTASGGNARIECFSINTGDVATVANFQYISFTNVPDDIVGGKRWPDELFDEITRALVIELHVIKSRIQEAEIRDTEMNKSLDQHE